MRARFTFGALSIVAISALSIAHEQPGLGETDPVGPGQESPDVYPRANIEFLSRVSAAEFGASAMRGNDCWGYVSPSGREYALMGLDTATGIVDITDPINPNIITTIPHAPSTWSDIKTYQNYAYVVNESGGGMQVIDLSQVDAGVATLLSSFTDAGLATAHNLTINEESGFAYLTGANGPANGLVVLSLFDPEQPQLAGTYSDAYVHDAQVVTIPDGPFSREIAFCFAGGVGIDVVDVTIKSNIHRLTRVTYPGLSYSHQGWYDAASQMLYVNDELDELGGFTATTLTRVFDVSDLSNVQPAGSFTTGLPAIDHNLYVHNGFVFEANYKSGLWIFDANHDPANPLPTGVFDTQPSDNSAGFSGAWSVYPYLPSGTVLVSDIERGLFVLDATAALQGIPEIGFGFPEGLPSQVDSGDMTLRVSLEGHFGAEIDPTSGWLVYRAEAPHTRSSARHDDGGHDSDHNGDPTGGGDHNHGDFLTAPLIHLGGNQYEAVLPPQPCGANVHYYFQAATTEDAIVTEPLSAPGTTYELTVNPKFADLTGDGLTNGFDLAATLGAWGDCPFAPAECVADINGDRVVNAFDLAALLGAWGECIGGSIE